ncbi:MAG: PAS domain S-box protein [Verrucomicrobiota bacterium]
MNESSSTTPPIPANAERLTVFYEAACEGLALIKDGLVLDATPRLAELLGCELSEIVGRPVLDFLAPQLVESVRQSLTTLPTAGTRESAMRKQDGSTVPVEVQFKTIDYQGQPVLAIAVRDITARKTAEMKFRTVFDQAGIGIIWVGADNQIVESNPQFQRLVGYTAEELLAQTPQTITHVLDWEYERKLVREAVENQAASCHLEKRYLHRNGHIVWVHLSISMLYNEQGKVAHYVGMATDISERKQAEHQHAMEEARMESLIHLGRMDAGTEHELVNYALEEGVRLTGSQYGYVAFANENESVLTMYAWSRDAMADCKTADRPMIFNVADTGLWGEPIRQRAAVFANDYPGMLSQKKGTPMGHVAIQSHLGVPVFQNQHIVAVVGVANKDEPYTEADARQLTLLMEGMWRHLERRRTQQAMRNSEERFRSIVHSSPMGIHLYDFAADDKLIMIGANPAADAILKRDHTDILGKTLEEAFPGLPQTDIPERYREVCRTGIPWQSEQLKYSDETISGAFEVHAFRAGPGRLAVMFFEITERLRAQSELRLLSTALESASNAMMITNHEGAVVWVNDSFTKMTGYGLSDIHGMTPRFLNSGKHEAAFYTAMWETILAGNVWQGELINRRKDGVLYTQEQTVTPVRDNRRRITHFIAVQQDITERKAMEEKLRQSSKMESIGRLAGGVAHDFNNLLTVIQGHTELLQLNTSIQGRAQDSLRQVSEAAKRAANLTRQLLAFGRKQPILKRPLDLNECVGNLTRMLQRIIGEDIRLEFAYQSRMPLVLADAGMMEQVLLNLSANARDAMPNGGRLVIGIETLRVTEDQARRVDRARAGEFVRLSVRDTGTGIPPEVLPRIFEPFFTTKDVGKGTGLGLSMVDGIVDQHQGWLEVVTSPGGGSTFFVYLPALARVAPLAEVPVPPPRVRGGTETILLVEDELDVRSLAKEILQMRGYRVLEADCGAAALKVWAEQHQNIQLLLTDIVMPGGLNGLDLAQMLLREKANLKVIYSSGYSSPLDSAQGTALHELKFYLQKPFMPGQLAQMVRRCLDEGPPATGVQS